MINYNNLDKNNLFDTILLIINLNLIAFFIYFAIQSTLKKEDK